MFILPSPNLGAVLIFGNFSTNTFWLGKQICWCLKENKLSLDKNVFICQHVNETTSGILIRYVKILFWKFFWHIILVIFENNWFKVIHKLVVILSRYLGSEETMRGRKSLTFRNISTMAQDLPCALWIQFHWNTAIPSSLSVVPAALAYRRADQLW